MSMPLLLACALAWPVAPVTSAGVERRIVVAPLAIEGEIAAPLRETLSIRLREGLDAEAFELVAPEQGAARTVRTDVVARDRDLQFTLTLVEPDGSTVVASVAESCDMCGSVEAGDMIASLGIALSRRAELASLERAAPAPPPPEPVVIDKPLPTQRRPVRWALGWSALAVGGVGVASGAALLAIHGQPIERKCSGSNVDADGTCRWTHSTLVSGAVITTLGVGLLATGIALVVIESRRGPRPALRALLERTPAWARARALVRR